MILALAGMDSLDRYYQLSSEGVSRGNDAEAQALLIDRNSRVLRLNDVRTLCSY
jgi:hypothetical protein